MRLLHAGCGVEPLPPHFAKCEEVRLDANPGVGADVVASITDIGDVGQFDCIYCSHVLEHLHAHEVPQALGEFRRVLKDGGVVVLFVPDLEDVEPTEEPLFDSPAGPITGRDMIYGHGEMIRDNPYMAHKTGFTRETLDKAFRAAGFGDVDVRRVTFNLLAIAR